MTSSPRPSFKYSSQVPGGSQSPAPDPNRPLRARHERTRDVSTGRTRLLRCNVCALPNILAGVSLYNQASHGPITAHGSSNSSPGREPPQGRRPFAIDGTAMTLWQGHLSSTSAALMALMLRCEDVDRPLISDRERALFTACEFWAATANGSLPEHLGSEATSRLSAVERAFSMFGERHLAWVVHRNLLALSTRPAAACVRRVAKDIEHGLVPMADSIDATLARVASEDCS